MKVLSPTNWRGCILMIRLLPVMSLGRGHFGVVVKTEVHILTFSFPVAVKIAEGEINYPLRHNSDKHG